MGTGSNKRVFVLKSELARVGILCFGPFNKREIRCK